MKRLLIGLLLVATSAFATGSPLSNCTHKARIGVVGYMGSETLANVPVLVRISESISGFMYADCGVDGAGLVFCDETETTIYPHEIDEWNPGGESLVWVRLPELAAGTAFRMGWGGTAAAPDSHAVWSDYAGVWHMNEDSGTAIDSTTNGLNGVPSKGTNTLADISQMVAFENGACGRARVNGKAQTHAGNYLRVPSYDALQLGSSFTVSIWLNGDKVNEHLAPRPISRKVYWKDANGWEFQINPGSELLKMHGSSDIEISAASPDISMGWVNVTLVYSGDSVSCYTNGSFSSSGTIVPVRDNDQPLCFGCDSDGTESTFCGQYDEIRLRGGTLSADRIRADYDMVANRNFLAFGAVMQIPNAPYIVIDLSAGSSAASYPITYLDEPPSGGFNVDAYKTTKLALRRIDPGTFMMCGQCQTTLTKPYYMGVFEVTQKQYELIMGSNPSQYTGDKRPVEQVSYEIIRGMEYGSQWPSTTSVDAQGFMGIIRARTGLGFDLPTEAQWEYACRAGTTSIFNNGGSSENDLKKLGRYSSDTSDGKGGFSQHTTVGSYLPNAWGLYDMHGNVREWCLDWFGNLNGVFSDPRGASSGENRIIRGGAWNSESGSCKSGNRGNCDPSTSRSDFGFRLSLSRDYPIWEGIISILAEGDLVEGVSIRLGGASEGWTLYYTTDGSEPTAASPAYTEPFTLAESATVKVVAVNNTLGWATGVSEQRFDLAPPLSITGARARQRYPWNGLVDIDFALGGDTSKCYRVSAVAIDRDGGTNLAVRTVWEDGGAVTNTPLDIAPGTHRFVWNASADLPVGFVADRVAISLRAETINDTALYMVVDLSGGPDAEYYPISYLPDVPEGGWTDEYKTDKIVLRRVEPGTFVIGCPEWEISRGAFDTAHKVTLTLPYYAGVFEMTQRQWELVKGDRPSYFVNESCYMTRPVETIHWAAIRGNDEGSGWPDNTEVDEDSFIAAFRAKTGNNDFDLPTEAQWEYACRAGTITSFNNGTNVTHLDYETNADILGRHSQNGGDEGTCVLETESGICDVDASRGTAKVGSYLPNAWGFYDMHGNVMEQCLDWFQRFTNETAIDPRGPRDGEQYISSVGVQRVSRGGGIHHQSSVINAGRRHGYPVAVSGDYKGDDGFRIFLHNAPAVVEAPIVAPQNLTATMNRTDDVTLAWEPVAGAYAYQIRRSKTGAFADGTWLNTVTNTTYADWTAEVGTNYTYWVRAQFESGRVGRWSEPTGGRRQGFWNGLFYITYSFEGREGEIYRIELSATDTIGGTNLPVRTVWREGAESVIGNPVDVPAPGTYQLVWNAAADLPSGFIADRVAISAKLLNPIWSFDSIPAIDPDDVWAPETVYHDVQTVVSYGEIENHTPTIRCLTDEWNLASKLGANVVFSGASMGLRQTTSSNPTGYRPICLWTWSDATNRYRMVTLDYETGQVYYDNLTPYWTPGADVRFFAMRDGDGRQFASICRSGYDDFIKSAYTDFSHQYMHCRYADAVHGSAVCGYFPKGIPWSDSSSTSISPYDKGANAAVFFSGVAGTDLKEGIVLCGGSAGVRETSKYSCMGHPVGRYIVPLLDGNTFFTVACYDESVFVPQNFHLAVGRFTRSSGWDFILIGGHQPNRGANSNSKGVAMPDGRRIFLGGVGKGNVLSNGRIRMWQDSTSNSTYVQYPAGHPFESWARRDVTCLLPNGKFCGVDEELGLVVVNPLTGEMYVASDDPVFKKGKMGCQLLPNGKVWIIPYDCEGREFEAGLAICGKLYEVDFGFTRSFSLSSLISPYLKVAEGDPEPSGIKVGLITNGGELPGIYAQYYKGANPVYGTLPTPTRSGQTFRGWSTDGTEAGIVATTDPVPQSGILLQAVWRAE